MTGFEISHTGTVEENIHRILNGQLDNIIGYCREKEEDTHKSVHEIRKSLKRMRAVLRLVRDEIGYSTYYRENVFYRDMSRQLSEIRQFNVLIDSTRILQADLSGTIPEGDIEPLIGFLLEKRDNLLERLVIQEGILGSISKQAVGAKQRIVDFPLMHDDFSTFNGGLMRIYRQGKRYRDLARQDSSTRNLHDLRKRMKYLWYQMLILQPIFPDMLKAYAATLDSIGENLGIYHDFAELYIFLEGHPGILEDHIHTTLMDGCEIKKTSILNRTWNAIDAIYSENPEDIAGRFYRYWKVYRNEQQADIIHSK